MITEAKFEKKNRMKRKLKNFFDPSFAVVHTLSQTSRDRKDGAGHRAKEFVLFGKVLPIDHGNFAD